MVGEVITPPEVIITAVAGLLHMWAQMLRGLSNVPGRSGEEHCNGPRLRGTGLARAPGLRQGSP